jgi:CMP-N-acetylneuraminic acid synthetase
MSCTTAFYKRMEKSQVLAVIPARKGSVRIPRKNTRLLGFMLVNPQPLVSWTFKCAKKAALLDRIIVSTDDEKVKDLAEKEGIEVPFFPRPKELSTDCDTALVIKHAVEFLSDKEGYKPRWVCLLQPTSPLRRPSEIDRAVEIAEKTGCDTVISVRKVREFPQWMFKGEEENGVLALKAYETVKLSGENLVSQSLPTLWYPTGSVYVMTYETVMDGLIFGRKIYGFETPMETSIDIETEDDLLFAEFILKKLEEEGKLWREYM